MSAGGAGPGREIPSGLSTALVIAALTWKRVVRGRTLWIAGVIAVLPVLFAAVMRSQGAASGVLGAALTFEQLVLGVLPPLFVASSIGDEIEDRTTTYLWSRPVPRWAVIVGKLLALAPIAVVVALASWYVVTLVGTEMPPPASYAALAAGAIAASAVATGIAVLVPRQGMALSICYMLFFDLSVGYIPAAIENVSISHQVRAIAGIDAAPGDTVATAALWLALVAAGWFAIGLARIRRLEA